MQGLKLFAVTIAFFSSLAFADAAGYCCRHEIAIDGVNGSFRHVHDWRGKSRELFYDTKNHEKFFSMDNDFSYVEFIDRVGNVTFHAPSPAFSKLWAYHDQYLVGLSNIKLNNPYQVVVWNGRGEVIYKAHITSNVAAFSDEKLSEFKQKFPEIYESLKDRFFVYESRNYCDCLGIMLPGESANKREAWQFLWDIRAMHPYIHSSESVTNWVGWYKEDADPYFDSSSKTIVIPVADGSPLAIPVEGNTAQFRFYLAPIKNSK